MTRVDFLAALTRAVRDGWLAEADAAALLREYDAGHLVELPDVLPLPDAIQGVRQDDSDHLLLIAFGLVLAAFGLRTAAERLPVLSLPRRVAGVDALQTAFEAQARQFAADLAAGRLTLADWQAAFGQVVRQHLAAQTLAGAGTRTLSPAQLTRLDALARRETAYLTRFADQIVIAQAQGQPLTEAQIGARSEQYAGTARGEFFRAAELAEMQNGGLGDGYVIEYVAVGDKHTCDPCNSAVGYYLPGAGPYPGQVCYGRSRCRCRRLWIYDPARYAELTRLG